MASRPVIAFDPPLQDIYRELVGDRAEIAGDSDADLARADAAVLGVRNRWDAAMFAKCPNLKVVSRSGIGYDNVDVAAATAAGVVVCNAPEAPSVSTAEHAIALMMAITKDLAANVARAQEGITGPATMTALELDGRTLGLVGFGRIARRVARVGVALDMTVLASDPFVEESPIPGVRMTSLDEVIARSDVLSLHAPALPETRHLINATTLAAMPAGSYLVNCARGSLVDQDALVAALDSGHLAGAAVDVTEPEPLPVGHPLLTHPKAIVTPHHASSTSAGRRRLFEHAIENALAVLDGRPATIVTAPTV